MYVHIGSVNYFPIKAEQSFDTRSMTITNGIFAGDFALLKFFGEFAWDEPKRKVGSPACMCVGSV